MSGTHPLHRASVCPHSENPMDSRHFMLEIYGRSVNLFVWFKDKPCVFELRKNSELETTNGSFFSFCVQISIHRLQLLDANDFKLSKKCWKK